MSRTSISSDSSTSSTLSSSSLGSPSTAAEMPTSPTRVLGGPLTPKRGPPQFKHRATRHFKSKPPKKGVKGYVSWTLQCTEQMEIEIYTEIRVTLSEIHFFSWVWHVLCFVWIDLAMKSLEWRVLAVVSSMYFVTVNFFLICQISYFECKNRETVIWNNKLFACKDRESFCEYLFLTTWCKCSNNMCNTNNIIWYM